MKTIKQLAEEHKISYQGMNKKIRNQLHSQLHDHIFIKDNVTVIDEYGEAVIIKSLQKNKTNSQEDTSLNHETKIDETVKLQEQLINEYKQRILEYKEEIKVKNEQIKDLSKQNTLLIEKVGNSQTLLGMHMLPKIDEQLINSDKQEPTVLEPIQKKSFWNYFKR